MSPLPALLHSLRDCQAYIDCRFGGQELLRDGLASRLADRARASNQVRFRSTHPNLLQQRLATPRSYRRGFEQADAHNFWEQSKKEMKAKMDKFTAVFDELKLPYSDPEGGYFVLVNKAKVKLPDDYEFPSHVAERPRDFKLSWFFN